ncbi:hypothetical protein CBS101457_006124 [Exobasidium rhododendri]|nr:hypothetical protein CBS101457_006124 [Exobasidium rhododendri]
MTLTNAQSDSASQLVVDAPQNALTCEAATVEWTWSGSQFDAETNTVSIAVEMTGDESRRRRSLAVPSPVRFVRKRSSMHARDTAINIAGGSNLPLSSGTWTWNSVGVPVGTYRMALTVENMGVTVYSDTFDVTAGPDTTCLGTLGTSSTTVSSTSTSLPSSTSTSLLQTVPTQSAVTNSSSSSTGATSTNPTSYTTPENQTNTQSSSHSLSSGGIAAAVIVPLLAVGVLLWLLCTRRQKKQVNEKNLGEWSEKFTGFFAGVRSGKSGSDDKGHQRQISGPIDPVHAAGHSTHNKSVTQHMRQAEVGNSAATGKVTSAPEHWVDFNPDVQDSDAQLVTSQRVNEMIKSSMEGPSRFYQQGANTALRQSGADDRHLTLETVSDGNSSLPSYLRDADFTSQHTHSSFGQEADGAVLQSGSSTAALDRSSSQRGDTPLVRKESKIRRKPAPTYSTYTIGNNQEASASSTSLGTPDDEDALSPFADIHQVSDATNATQSLSASGDREYLDDNRALPLELLTPVNSSRSFPVSVYSSVGGDSPAPRTLLETPRQASSEDQEEKEKYKLSVQLPHQDRGFRVSF